MAGEYYAHTTFPTTGASGSSAAMRTELDAIQAGFDKLPPLSGNAYKITYVNAAAAGVAASSSLFTDVNGNLGIGTNSPSRKLTISGSGAQGSATVAAVRLDNASSARSAIIDLDDSQNLTIWNSDSGAGSIRFLTGAGAGTERTRVDYTGFVIDTLQTGAPTLTVNNQMTMQLVSNTQLKILVRGSDGVTRSTTLTLA